MSRRNPWGVLFVVLVVAVAGLAIFQQARVNLRETEGKTPFRLGLDLQGGAMMIVEVQDPPGGKATQETVEDARVAIERRIDQLGVVEPTVERMKGDNWRRIVITVPGVTNLDQAQKLVGTKGMLTFKLGDQTVLGGGDILKTARATWGGELGNEPAVSFELTSEAAKKFAQITRENVGQYLAIYLDDDPVVGGVIREEIPNGQGQISPLESIQDAATVAAILRGGVLPAPIEIKETRFVDPTLGASTVRQSMIAGIVGVAAVFLFMMLYYRLPGVVAAMALAIYMLISLAVFMAIKATLSLAGVAGFILSVGMAVDANVIIFERIKEELRAGKRLHAAIQAGFTRAFSAIFDSNLTTLITAAILFYFGTTRVQGFALTLSIGILTSMFTAITVTRILLRAITDADPERYARWFGVSEGR